MRAIQLSRALVPGRWCVLVAMTSVAIYALPGTAEATSLVRVGVSPVVPSDAQRLQAPTASSVVHATVMLNPSDPGALASYATAVSTPASAMFRRYLTVRQFAASFGPSAAQITAVRAVLRGEGLHPGAVSPNGLSIQVHGSFATFSAALDTTFAQYRLKGGRVAYANTSAPKLPATIASTVQGVIGLDDLVQGHSGIAKPTAGPATPASPASPASPNVETGGPQPCAAATAKTKPTSNGDFGYTADQLASAYDFSGFYQTPTTGGLGGGQTVALYELEPDAPSDIAAYQACYGTHATVSYVTVDGGVPAGPGSGEASLDIENVISAAPDAADLVYQAPNTDQGDIDNWTAIISQDKANVVSTSWGYCEPDQSSPVLQAENTLFEEAATQGQSIVAAAGDAGSEDCSKAEPTETQLAVHDPAGQPFVTAVGGTVLPIASAPGDEGVWNTGAGAEGGAGGGGISQYSLMPAYQSGAPASLNVINANSSGGPCEAAAGGYCREVPDVSLDADPNTGFVVYQAGHWGVIGGTSGAAPLFAAFLALTNAVIACPNIGFANPALYAVAGSSAYAADFYDIDSSNNDYLNLHGGLYPAGIGYDMASGLGAVNGANLAYGLCTQTSLEAPGVPTIGTATAGDAQATVTFSAPVSTGGSPISRYTVTATDLTSATRGGQTVSGTGSPLTVTGLTDGDSYTFTVTATNTHGMSPASAASNAVTPVAPAPPGNPPSIDGQATSQGHLLPTVRLTTGGSGDLLVAFVRSSSPFNAANTVTVFGGGLRWTRAGQENTAHGDAEVWTAHATGTLTAVPITAVEDQHPLNDDAITVIAFHDATGIGATGEFFSLAGAPTGTITTTQSDSWVFAAGNDRGHAVEPTAGPGQTIEQASTDAGPNTYWVQSTTTPTATAGTAVTINDTAPIDDRYNLVLVEVL